MRSVILFLDEEKTFAEYGYLLPLISEERRERIERMAVKGDKVRSLFSELLMRYEASEQLGVDFNELIFDKGEFGKPYIVGFGGYDFSVSHSGQAIAFAGGFSAVGADIELIKRRRNGASQRFFAENEVRYIEQSANSDEAFFEIWTKKEAYSKMLGKGLSLGFRSFDVTYNELGGLFYSITTHGYAFSVCSEEIEALQSITEITESEFLQKLNFTLR
ncbi:MAG: 4'-phosphopantetheinyl transferase family protein [Oscillospiraceae bacterium]